MWQLNGFLQKECAHKHSAAGRLAVLAKLVATLATTPDAHPSWISLSIVYDPLLLSSTIGLTAYRISVDSSCAVG